MKMEEKTERGMERMVHLTDKQNEVEAYLSVIVS